MNEERPQAPNAFVRFTDRLALACAAIASVFLAIAVVVICWMVVYRAMGNSTYWEIEFAVFMMVAALFLGSPYCLMTSGHVAVDLLSHYLPPDLKRPLAVFVCVVGLLVCLYLAWATGSHTLDVFLSGERTESSWAPPLWPLYLTMPVGFGLTMVQYAAELSRIRSGAPLP
ncbi:MAG: TRAP transporter small permease [Burkholderiales bacterium]|nr:MAG: TRAP transporter small permease [Burkholderiales bacterium]